MSRQKPRQCTLVVAKGQTKEVPVAELKVGNTFLVQAGQSIPVDGIVLAGETTVLPNCTRVLPHFPLRLTNPY